MSTLTSFDIKIGNIVQVENDYETITGLLPNKARCLLGRGTRKNKGVWQEYRYIKPVLLNLKWFKMFGFDTSNNGYYKKGIFYITVYPLLDGKYEYSITFLGSCIPVRYVNQLQNWYYLCTREMLNPDKRICHPVDGSVICQNPKDEDCTTCCLFY